MQSSNGSETLAWVQEVEDVITTAAGSRDWTEHPNAPGGTTQLDQQAKGDR